jgi:integrase
VSYGGSKTFRVLTYTNGKPHSRKLGLYPQMTVKQARQAARDYWTNPEKFEAQAQPDSFKEVAEQWITRHVEKQRLRSQAEIERCLKVYVYPKFGDRKFLDIRRGDINALLDYVEDHHGSRQADMVLAIIRGVMNWYQTRNEFYVCPVVKGMRRHNGNGGRSRILTDEELRAVWQAAGDCGTFGAFCRVALLCSQRKSKVLEMRWDSLDGEGVWTIPTEEREKGNPGLLKLPQMALDIINAQPRLAGNPYVFAGRDGKPLVNLHHLARRALDAKLPKDTPRWTVHDLRRSARSLMSRAGVLPHVAEQVLGHRLQGVEGIYDRHTYAHEKADALERLAALVGRILNPPAGSNVVEWQKKA